MPAIDLDAYENLILLCANDHQLINSPSTMHTTAALRQLKSEHERWVDEHLDIPTSPAERSERVHLTHARNGRELLHLVAGMHAVQFDHPEPRDPEETEAIAEFSEEIHDGIEVIEEMSGAQRVRFGIHLTSLIHRLGEFGLLVWCAERPLRLRQPDGTTLQLRTAVVLVRRMSEDADLIAPHLHQIQDALGTSETLSRLSVVRLCLDAILLTAGPEPEADLTDDIHSLLAGLQESLEPFVPSALAECRALAQLGESGLPRPHQLREAAECASAVVDAELKLLRQHMAQLRAASTQEGTSERND